jgi:hypothetical protein
MEVIGMSYDSTSDTLEHIRNVSERLYHFGSQLALRAKLHDQSKLDTPEKEALDQFTPLLKGLTYGSQEYKDGLEKSGPAMDIYLKHHYANNRHHPEFHGEKGVAGMTLIDLVEMLCDWRAATERHATGNILRSLEINRERFKLSDQLYEILLNTVKALGWDQASGQISPDKT